VEFLPEGKSGKTNSRGIRVRSRGNRTGAWLRPAYSRAAVLAGAAGLFAILLPGGIAEAQPAGTPASLQATVAEANALSNEIDSLGQQYDDLKIQLQEAQAESSASRVTAARDQKALKAGRTAVAQIADQGYMTGSLNPTIQLLQSDNPQAFLNRSSILLQLDHQQGTTVNLLSQAVAAAARAQKTATQEQAQATKLAAEMSTKVGQIQAKENVLNSQAFAQALAVFQQTGSYPQIPISGDSVGEQALRWALTRLGDPYVWGGAGPDDFDCSGLVMWAYAHVGISLAHFTGDQWTEGEHIPQNQLEPGDLVFFFADISHVGMYIGNGMMVDAPSAGQVVQVQPIFWSAFVGAVRIVA
jgi:cell wall-associated NlpC family hydrolase